MPTTSWPTPRRCGVALDAPPWSVLGASFGGFIILNYLSAAPDGLREAFISGGLPAVREPLDDIYEHTYGRMLERNRRYYLRYPDDRERVRRIVAWLDTEKVLLPDGSSLSPRRFAQLGWNLGMSYGAETLHYISNVPRARPRSPSTYGTRCRSVASGRPCTRFCTSRATPMASRRAGLQPASFRPSSRTRTLFTGEHIFPWMFDECRNLIPLKDAADLLADHEWGYLYDPDVLRANTVPTAAVVYSEDPYVDAFYSLQTAALTHDVRVWLTNEFEHNGLRASAGNRVLDRLIALARGAA